MIEKLKEDVENLVYNFFVGNYQDSFEEEIDEIRRLLPLLSECFPDECKTSIIKYQNQSKLVLPKILKKTK